MSEPKAAQFVCEHAYGTRILGGHPIAVRSCALCHRPDWDDLYREAEALFRWGWQEGAAGEPPREKLSSYDRPKEGGLQLLACSLAHCRQAHPPHSWAPQPGMNPVHCGGSSGDPATTWSPEPCGRTVPHPGHKFMRGRAAHQCPGVEQRTDLAADIECAIGLNTGGGGADGVYAARDAVLAAIRNHSAANVPGATTEQLPADVLPLLVARPYLSTACETARLLDGAIIRNPDRGDLPEWRDRMHTRCRLNHKFTGELCSCSCHHP